MIAQDESFLPPDGFGPALVDFIETRPRGIVFLDRRRRVVFANRRAREMAASGDSFSLSGASITALRREDNDMLQQLITRAAGPDASARSAMRLPRRSGKHDYVLTVGALRAGATPAAGPVQAVCILIGDPDGTPVPPAELLRDLYGLTPREARLAEQLARGETPNQAAKALGIGIATVREHLSALLHKTETSRQTDLVRLLLLLALGIDAGL